MLVFVELSFVSHPGRLVQPLYNVETGQTPIRQNKEGELEAERSGSGRAGVERGRVWARVRARARAGRG